MVCREPDRPTLRRGIVRIPFIRGDIGEANDGIARLWLVLDSLAIVFAQGRPYSDFEVMFAWLSLIHI